MRKLTLGLSVCSSGRLSRGDSRTFYAFSRETVYLIRLRLTGSLIIHFSSRARLLRPSTHIVYLKAGITLQFNDIFLPTYLATHVGKLSIKGMAVQGESLYVGRAWTDHKWSQDHAAAAAAILPNYGRGCFYYFDSFNVYYSNAANVSVLLYFMINIRKFSLKE